jgi:hypothetical protein
MPEEIVTRILRLPGHGVYGWETDEATNTLTLVIRQTAEEPPTSAAAAASRCARCTPGQSDGCGICPGAAGRSG